MAGSGGRARGGCRPEKGALPLAPRPILERLDFPVPSRTGLPSLKKYAHVEKDGRFELAGYVEASRGCKHLCRHCPIPPVYGGRLLLRPRDAGLPGIPPPVAAGAAHITFGDPHLPNR